MGSFSIWHWLIVLVVVLILFGGRGKISQLMGDFGKGLRSFKKSMREDEAFDDQTGAPPPQLSADAVRVGEPAGTSRPANATATAAEPDKAARG